MYRYEGSPFGYESSPFGDESARFVTEVPHSYKSSLSNVTKVPCKCYESSSCYECSPFLLQKFPFFVTKVPMPMALSLSLSPSLSLSLLSDYGDV